MCVRVGLSIARIRAMKFLLKFGDRNIDLLTCAGSFSFYVEGARGGGRGGMAPLFGLGSDVEFAHSR